MSTRPAPPEHADEIRRWTSANLLARAAYHNDPSGRCGNGHMLTEITVRIDPKTGHRKCRPCQRDRKREGLARKAVAA